MPEYISTEGIQYTYILLEEIRIINASQGWPRGAEPSGLVSSLADFKNTIFFKCSF